MKKYLKVWLKWLEASFASVFGVYKLSASLFLLGKVVRFLFFLLVILIFVGKTKALGDYTLDQAILFFLVFNLVDILSQFFFRGVYWFRQKLISGQFDYLLLKPVNPLFQVLVSHPDPLDLITLVFLIGFIILFILKSNLSVGLWSVFLFFLLLASAFILALALHILISALGIMSLTVDHLVWIYRDVIKMGRIPIDLYAPLLRGFLTFAIPVALMITFPAKALIGLLSWRGAVFSFVIGSLFLRASLSFWKFALTRYASASS